MDIERKETLLNIFKDVDNFTLIENLIDDMLYMEEQLEYLKKLPFIKVHPKNPTIQKQTDAYKVYRNLFQQYNNTIRTLAAFIRHDDVVEKSPLEEYLEKLQGM